MDIYKNNLSAQIRMTQAIGRSNKWSNKYNESMHRATEELTGEPNDRTAYDVGTEKEVWNEVLREELENK